MDLRFFIPPILNLIFFLFFSSLNCKLLFSSLFVQRFSVLQLGFVFLAMMFLLLFLFTSAECPFTLSPIHFHLGAFFVALTASLVASLFFPPSLFWPFHLLIVFSSPWHSLFFDVFKRIFGWFGALQSVPAYTITINARNDENSNPIPPQEDVELGLMLSRTSTTKLNSASKEECLMTRRTLAAHLDYIDTQKTNP